MQIFVDKVGKHFWHNFSRWKSVADPERFDEDPDPAFMVMRIQIRILITVDREKKTNFFKNITNFSKILKNLFCVIFSVQIILWQGGVKD